MIGISVRGFLLQCTMVFEQQLSRLPFERVTVAYTLALLTGWALAWATPVWVSHPEVCASVVQYTQALYRTFEYCGDETSLVPWPCIFPRISARSSKTC